MEHIFSRLENFGKIVSSNSFLLIDYDGTLTPIVEEPELAVLGPEMRKLLRGVVGKFKVAIISGRSLPDVARRGARRPGRKIEYKQCRTRDN